MIRVLARCIVWLCVAMPPALCAATAAAPPLPLPTALLVDETGLLDEDTRQSLLQRLEGIQAAGRAQVAILLAQSTHGEVLADYSLRVAESWKLGHAGRDDGLLVVVVPAGKAARIEVGYGLEGAIPDLRAMEWVDELLPAIGNDELAQGLHRLLDRIEAALPRPEASLGEQNILERHPEWKLPFVLAIFSPFALFPLFMGSWGGFVSAPLFAAFMGAAAWMLWEDARAAWAVAALAFVLPLLWGLNGSGKPLPRWLVMARHAGNFAAVAIFFSLVTIFVGAGLSGNVEQVWAAPLFAGALALGLAVFLFPGTPGKVVQLVLRSYMHFLFVLVVAYLALVALIPEPAPIAFAAAGCFTALVALSLYLEVGAKQAGASGAKGISWSLWLTALALLVVLPFAGLLLVQSALGVDLRTQLAQAAAGGGSLGGLVWWAARQGFFAALSVGLGGRFGGGGAEGRS